jgi:hypothetical protein
MWSCASFAPRVWHEVWPVSDFYSIIVPVHNAEGTLSGQVAKLVEVLPDLAGRFEIVVVDDGSTDQTVDIARELACTYPQLRLIRHPEHRGKAAALKTGSQWAQGQTILLHDLASPLSSNHWKPARAPKTRSPADPQSPASLPQARADHAHPRSRPARYATAFLRHLRDLTLGE